MNSLPDLTMYHVFKYLDVADLFACRLVSRRFRFFADTAKLNELIVEGDKEMIVQGEPRCWYFTKEPVNKSNRVLIANLGQMLTFPFHIAHLRRLIIALPLSCFEPTANFLNRLTKLKQLEILDLEDLLKDETLTVALPELESFYIGEVTFHLTLDCPVLKAVFCDSGFDHIKFVHPESIEQLTIDIFYWDEHYSGMFENIRYFQLNWFDTLNRPFLACLPNVREFRMYQKYKEDLDQYFEAEENMNYLIDWRAKLGKTETLRISYEDVEIVGNERFASYKFYLDFGLNYIDVNHFDSELEPLVCAHCGLVHMGSDDSLIDSDIDQPSGEEASGDQSSSNGESLSALASDDLSDKVVPIRDIHTKEASSTETKQD